MQGKWGLRAVALLAVGALTLHELSYWLIDGVSGVGGHTHSYMPLAVGLVTVLLLLACASFARTLVYAMRGIEDEGDPPPFRVLWPLLTVALLARVLAAGVGRGLGHARAPERRRPRRGPRRAGRPGDRRRDRRR